MSLTLDDKLVVPPDVMARVVGEETVILHLGSGSYFGLNEVGSRIWQLITEQVPLAQIPDVLLKEYAVDREAVVGDLFELIANLQARGLLVVVSPRQEID